MSHNPHDWSDGIPDCIIFASTADAERGAAMYRSMADSLDAQEARIKALEGALRELIAAGDNSVSADDDVAAMLRYGEADKQARALLVANAE